ncbi:Glutathione-regulated potassium-efflux system protein KefC [Lunatimonas lonarensis]|uniref:Glutathione-regulated potassium-efflux system protein KefC n=1 Tax=Lunatimonas lonarensis TaxID=1232681 RepID=R7ZNZ8_9BACT|nr:monovalent cation:proton antiporter family protein [Lunatimonas lonarensis]EON75778.1 Glutathione-regulated potassium-efflux system protein KefC [Lunatimonas lonarensis]
MFPTLLAAAEIPLLSDIVVIFGLATLVILLFMRLKLPTIIGYLFTGAIAGPYGLSLVDASTAVEVLSEIGVILLLFVIGMEFSLRSLMAIKKAVFIGGALQVLFTIGFTTLVSYLFGFSWPIAVFFGFLFSLSSTAIVLKILQEAGQVNTISGRTTLAILIFQDIIIVPFVLFTPMLAGESDNILLSLLLLAFKGGVVIVLTILGAKYVIPKILFRVARTRNEELFLLSIIVICFAVAYATSLLGLSLGLGAFLAGLIISESEYSHHATGKILPFREIFLSFFFVSVGMLFDVSFLYDHLLVILLLVLLTFVLKFTAATLAVRAIGSGYKEAFIVGFSLFQVGEFSLLLAKEGLKYNLLDNETYQYFLAISILTMGITPFLLKNREILACRILNAPLPSKIKNRLDSNQPAPIELDEEKLNDHLVIIGYGLNGRNLARAAKTADIPFAIIEMNPETVRDEAAKGEPIVYGDASNGAVLEHINIHKARVVVVAISNSEATKSIVLHVRSLNPNASLIVRTRYVNEIESLMHLGADEVIPEEFETSIEIFTRVLNKYLVPKRSIAAFTEDVRTHNYEMFRYSSLEQGPGITLDVPEINFVSVKIEKDTGPYLGQPIKDINLREKANVNLVAIKREGVTETNITGETRLKLGDVIYLVGKPEALQAFEKTVSLPAD